VKAVLTAAGIAVDDARVKALVAALDGINIDEAISKAAAAPVAVAAAPAAAAAGAPAAAAAEEETPEEKKEEEESGMAGLGALFG
jgi:large subunit ribosomal protein L12